MTVHTEARPRRRAVSRMLAAAGVLAAALFCIPPAHARTGGRPVEQAAQRVAEKGSSDETVLFASGVVRGTDGEALAGASVSLAGAETVTDAAGLWSLPATPGEHQLIVSHSDGFATLRRDLRITRALARVEVTLVRLPHLRENVVVEAVRADARTPVTKTGFDREQIEELNRGQEMPFLLGSAPAVNFQSDNGLAAGYSYFNIRGVTQTRLNITLDGVPLQDPEDQALYFSNFGDFASVVESVQIQRGVGTSSYGSASYGGSVSFASVDPGQELRLQGQLGLGSWGTQRGTLALDSGPMGGGVALYGRFSAQTTDGFREHSGVDQRTLYFGGTRQDERSVLKLFGIVGREQTQLSYLATDEATLEENLRHNDLTLEDTDDFGQDVFHLQYTRLVGGATTLRAQAYYNGAQGWYRISDFASGDLLEFGLDGHFIGLILGATHNSGRLELKWGAHINDFRRDHFMDIVGGSRAYGNTGFKNEYSTFLQASWDAGRRTRLWADAQLRHARFEYQGSQDLGSVSWTFFNPKAGIRFDASPSVGLYTTIGHMSREPARSDMLHGEDDPSQFYDLSAVEPERVLDVEAGVEWERGGLRVRADVYAMEFRDEIALSGELSEIGLPVRRNTPRSSRRGVEAEVDWRASRQLRLVGTASLSRNRLAEWTQFYDVYAESGDWIDSVPLVHTDVPPLLTPEAILNGDINWTPSDELGLSATARWVAASQLDNTGNADFRTPSYFSLDGQLTLSLAKLIRRGVPQIRLQATNLLGSERIWPSGYSYLYFLRDKGGRDDFAGTSYYYPLATRSVYVTLGVTF